MLAHGPVQVAQNKLLHTAFELLLPLAAFVVVCALAYGLLTGDVMYASGLGAAAVGLAMFRSLLRLMPATFSEIGLRGLIEPREVTYGAFLEETEAQINGRGALLFSFLLVLLVGTVTRAVTASADTALPPLAVVTGLGLELIIALISAVALTRMGVIGWQIARLARRFTLRVHPGHPDGCGGFRGIGTLCLVSGLILTVPGVWLGFWLLAAPTFGYGSTYLVQHSVLAIVTLGLAVAAFGLPLYEMHRAMLRDTVSLRSNVRILEQQLGQSTRALLLDASNLEAGIDDRLEKLNTQRDFYAQHHHIPTWPIRASRPLLFAALQAVPTTAVAERVIGPLLGGIDGS